MCHIYRVYRDVTGSTWMCRACVQVYRSFGARGVPYIPGLVYHDVTDGTWVCRGVHGVPHIPDYHDVTGCTVVVFECATYTRCTTMLLAVLGCVGLVFRCTILLVLGVYRIYQDWCTTMLPAVLGCALVVLGVYRERSLQTATNYFIVSLAIADIMVAILVMPLAVYVEVRVDLVKLKVSLRRVELLMEPRLTATGCHMM